MNATAKHSQTALPLPNPDDWLTRAAAAEVLGVDPATVSRMVEKRRLKAYAPATGPGDTRPPAMFWRAEVDQLREARKIAREGIS